jgi:hypothetical protein
MMTTIIMLWLVVGCWSRADFRRRQLMRALSFLMPLHLYRDHHSVLLQCDRRYSEPRASGQLGELG